MATRTLQPSEYDIQREVEALRDIRRRSTNPGALIIDPDLPNQTSSTSPTSYRLTTSSDDSSAEGPSGSGTSSSSNDTIITPNNSTDDPFHLFWVPASVHPEIAPAEFRAFLKAHSRSPSPSEDGSDSAERSTPPSSLSSDSNLGRRKSMLSRQYKPEEHEIIENERIVPLRRNRSSFHANNGPPLTISDLQKLEQLAEEASASDDPSKLRSMLRRSLSMNISPSAAGLMNEIHEMPDEADAPIIVPPPGQILRRAARTKIRKPTLSGDGGGHRFGSSRRKVSTRSATAPVEGRSSSDISSSDHGDSVEYIPIDRSSRPRSEEQFTQRPDSLSEETSIFDAYAREEEEDIRSSVSVTSSPPSMLNELPEETSHQHTEIQPALLEALGPAIQHPEPQHRLSPQRAEEQQGLESTPSSSQSPLSVDRPSLPPAPPSFLSTVPSPPPQSRKERDKKGIFGKWGGDKSGKKAKSKDPEKERVAEKEQKETGFFGSLFGSKKKQDEVPPPLLSPNHPGREAAQALLGTRSKGLAATQAGGLSAGVDPNNYSRYPIHVERAIYRLSHIKLANPRRPLYEQVLISNLMFWYLGVINKAQNPQPSPNGLVNGASPGQADEQPAGDTDLGKEREQQELREQAETEQVENERLEREREAEVKKRESGRKGSLTKAPAPGMPGGGRRAEIPVKGPQYEMQHRVMEQEYSGYTTQHQQGILMGRSTLTPVTVGNDQNYPRNPQQPPTMQFGNSQLPQSGPSEIFYYTPPEPTQQQPMLPPGAMAPDQQMWQSVPQQPTNATPNPSRSTPPYRNHGRYNPSSSQDNLIQDISGERIVTRSLSASAVPTQPLVNGRTRKGNSAHAIAPSPNRRPQTVEGQIVQDQIGNGDEDIPLAMWQQQRRR